ncbi:MAG: hypothetical protein J6Q73_08390 [Bacteroidaceae bacterium]|nr:hypothetical protein [Bacteroidaceae bacterium]
MKRLFVALMAILVLASCGAQKEEKKTASDVIMMTVEIIKSATGKVEKAGTADELVDAISAMVEGFKELKNKYGDILAELQEMDEGELSEKYVDEIVALEEAAMKCYETILEKEQEVEMTPEAEEKMVQVLMAVEEL